VFCSCAQRLSLVAPSEPPATAARPTKRPNKALTSGRVLFVYSLDARAPDGPNSLVRAEDDLSIVKRRENLGEAAIPAALLSRLAKVYSYGIEVVLVVVVV